MTRVLAWARAWLVPSTLFGRLALLLSVAVLVSHALALKLMFEMGPHLFGPGPGPGSRPGVYAAPNAGRVGEMPPPPMGPAGRPVGPGGQNGPRPFLNPGLWVDVGIRLAALMLAAWIGARWLSQPVRRLANAAHELGRDIHRAPLVEAGTDECREATRVFNQMQAQICRQLSERDSFVAAVSHDLRTPLTRLALRAEGLADAQQRLRFGRDIAEMNNMITATLDYLRGAANAEPFVLLDVDSMLRSLADDYAACGHAVELVDAEQPHACAPLRTQASALRRCINNLVDNAIQYGGHAWVRCYETPGHVCIEIRDRGPGIAEADMGRVLTPFQRVEGSRNRHSGGVGLGLSIAQDIAQRLHGMVRLQNGEKEGLVVTVALPRTVPDGAVSTDLR